MIRRLVLTIMSIALVISSASAGLAAPAAPATSVPAINLTINGYPLKMDVPPVNIDGRVMVPARAIVESLGGGVEWLPDKQVVLVYRFSSTDVMALTIGETTYSTLATDAAGPQQFDKAPVIIDGRTLVPVRLLATFIGGEISWDEASKTVAITCQPYTGPKTMLKAHEAFASRYRPTPVPVAQTPAEPVEPPPATPTGKTPILGKPAVSAATAAAWAKNRGATDEFVSLAAIYWACATKGGARPDVAYAQAAKETGLGKFGGVIDASYHNPCGMKCATSGNGTDYVASAHQRFASWEEGVRAHLHHLELYAGKAGTPYASTPDPRHFAFLKGTALYVEDLSGKWAPGADYGRNIVNDCLNQMIDLEKSGVTR